MNVFRRVSRLGSLPLALLMFFVFLFALYYFFFPKPPPKPDATWTQIQQSGVLKIGVDPSFPPFESDDGKGNLSGFDIALANALAQKWNVRVQYVYTGYDGLYDALNGGQFDLILSALPYNPDKTQDVNFSHSYFNGGPVLVVRANDNQTKRLDQLAQRALAVELGTSGDAYARHWQRRLKFNLSEFNSTNDALHAVAVGLADAALVDPISFVDYARASAGRTDAGTLQAVGKPLADELYVIAARKNAPTLLQQINAAIDAMKRDGSLEELQKRWF
jgi:polar amino acid transport system substrate-binding protein